MTAAAARRRLRRVAPGVLALVVVAVIGPAGVLAVHRQHVHQHRQHQRAGGAPGSTPTPAPSTMTVSQRPPEPGLPVTLSTAIHSTGRGRGLARLIPCYTVTSRELSHILGAPMALVGQRAAGENGSGLSGTQREDCFWFSTQPDGPYVVLSDVTTDELAGRSGMSGWTARRYFEDVAAGPRTYLTGIGDAAYTYGSAHVAALVGDVYLDVYVVTDDGHPLHDGVAIAKLMAKLRTTLSR